MYKNSNIYDNIIYKEPEVIQKVEPKQAEIIDSKD